MSSPPAAKPKLDAHRVEVTLATEAQQPKCFLNDVNVALERGPDNRWTGSVQQRPQSRPVSLRLELGEPAGATWDLEVKWGQEVVYSSHGRVVAPDGRVTAEIHDRSAGHNNTSTSQPPRRLCNETPHRVFIAARNHRHRDEIALQIPPWGERVVTVEERDALDLEPWKTRSIIRDEPFQTQPELIPLVVKGVGLGLFMVGFYAVLIWGIWSLVGEPPAVYWRNTSMLAAAAAIIGPILLVAQAGQLWPMIRRAFSQFSWMQTLISVSATVLIAFGLPLLFMAIGEGCCVREAAAAGSAGGQDPWPVFHWFGSWLRTAAPADVLGRTVQLLVIGTLSLLPALLYYLFDRRKLSGLRLQFFRSVVMIDPDVRTLEDARSVYGVRADEVLGPAAARDGLPSIQLTRQLVILVATLVVTVGWLITLDPLGTDANRSLLGFELFRYVSPQRDALVFAFLGGYAFGIAMLFRRYVRSDLKPEAFAHLVVRVVTAVLITWALAELPFMYSLTAQPRSTATDSLARTIPSDLETAVRSTGPDSAPTIARSGSAQPAVSDSAVSAAARASTAQSDSSAADESTAQRKPRGFLLALVFFVGVFPETGFTFLREFLQKRVGPRLPTLEEKLPLELLDGINIYHRTRLMDEGIDNLENLAHADIIDLMLGTRIPLETLIDWLDQAILMLHLGVGEDRANQLAVLRSHGIRTATDLERTLRCAVERDKLLEILGRESGGPARLQTILDALSDDQWMPHVRRCRRSRMESTVVSPSLFSYWDVGKDVFHEEAAKMNAASTLAFAFSPIAVPAGEG
jgi:hypothetical protein